MKTLAEALTWESQAIDGRDVGRLMDFLPLDQWKQYGFSYNGDDIDDFTPKDWTEANVKAQLRSDLSFGYGKALDMRGISSACMASVVEMWAWILADRPMKDDDSYYCKDTFREVAKMFGYEDDLKQLDYAD